MPIVAGVDFGTLSVRVSLLDSERGRLGTASARYPLHRRRDDPDFATQFHEDQMHALVRAMRDVLDQSAANGADVVALALDTTGSRVIPIDAQLRPLDEYLLWCDHRAHKEAHQITALAHNEGLEAIEWCSGFYSHEWGFAKLLYWLRDNPEKRKFFATALEHCDMVAATLIGITEPTLVPRSVCAMGHKWLWNPLGWTTVAGVFVASGPSVRWGSCQARWHLSHIGVYCWPSRQSLGPRAGAQIGNTNSGRGVWCPLGRDRSRVPRR